ncbi:hypothetical protein FB45DRAFT_979675 [Roridomyces roridus]|uniref:DUF6589 domain-containing protein n=1 Tax=Roridomyces roridus TaxID=1738132 RepID=A0AAD7FLS2_9AGAR|nr:hypothetical protein FB45DRAFT_979675 [Roridomyces roridus]
MEPHVREFACSLVADEMETRHDKSVLSGIQAVTPEFMDLWDEPEDSSPFVTQILTAVAQSKRARLHNTLKTPEKLCKVVTQQLLYQRSHNCLAFQATFGLFLWSTGTARQTIDAAFRCGLSVSYDSVLKHIALTADRCVEEAMEMSKRPHSFNYDNVNISTSIFVEQRGASGPAKVTSGTFAVLCGLRNAKWEHMLITPIMKRLHKFKGLEFNRDIRPSVQHIDGFRDLLKFPHLQHAPLRPYPANYTTPQCPVRASTTEEATTRGNLLFQDEVYTGQLKRDPESLGKHILQLGLGLFHLCLNLVWAILHTHRGSVNNAGSLAYFFLLMEKARLGGEQPDYHTLLAALMQVLDGLVLNAWMRECGFATLELFAQSKPTAERLRSTAAHILHKCATPLPDVECTEADAAPSEDEDSASDSDGDFGRVEVLLPHLTMMFRGSGCNKYCTEILHFIQNLKHIWTPEFA